MNDFTHYKCRYPNCEEYEEYRAVGNLTRYAHLCATHWKIDPNKELFVKVNPVTKT